MKFHSISLGLGSARLRANFEYSHVTVSLSRPVWHYQLQPPFPVFRVFNTRPLDEKGEPKKKTRSLGSVDLKRMAQSTFSWWFFLEALYERFQWRGFKYDLPFAITITLTGVVYLMQYKTNDCGEYG